jgi:hypothetical protein
MTYYNPLGYYPQHCVGCRCGESTTTTVSWPSGIFYEPKHRKQGPAQ